MESWDSTPNYFSIIVYFIINMFFLKLRYDRRSGNYNLRNYNLTHGLCISAAVLKQLSYEDSYIVSRPIMTNRFVLFFLISDSLLFCCKL